MFFFRHWFVPLGILGLVCCAGCRMVPATSPELSAVWFGEDDESDAEVAKGSASTLKTIALYIPNRVFDLFEIARFGVNAGPGFGVDVRATEFVQAIALSRASVGVGLQGLRRLPVSVATESGIGLGPVDLSGDLGLAWYRAPLDLRVELHALLIGAHAAVDIGEIFDFLAGIIVLDPSEDDF